MAGANIEDVPLYRFRSTGLDKTVGYGQKLSQNIAGHWALDTHVTPIKIVLALRLCQVSGRLEQNFFRFHAGALHLHSNIGKCPTQLFTRGKASALQLLLSAEVRLRRRRLL